MKILKGVNGEILEIRINGRADGESAELWIEQIGLKKQPPGPQRYETLSYISLDELRNLKREIDAAIKEMCGIT